MKKGDPVMSDPRDPVLRQAVDKLMQNAQYLQGLFAQNYQNEGNRPILVSGFEDEGIPIKKQFLYTDPQDSAEVCAKRAEFGLQPVHQHLEQRHLRSREKLQPNKRILEVALRCTARARSPDDTTTRSGPSADRNFGGRYDL
jgi:hypothetical protein